MSQIIYGDNNYILKEVIFNYNRVSGLGKPTRVARGAFQGYSLPVFGDDDEELFGCLAVPQEWNQTGDMTALACGWLASANTDKNFKLELSWSFYDPSTFTTAGPEVVSDTTIDVVTETATGTASQYQSFLISFTLNTSEKDIAPGCPLGIRLRRLDASSDEISGEFVVEAIGVKIPINKTGSAT